MSAARLRLPATHSVDDAAKALRAIEDYLSRLTLDAIKAPIGSVDFNQQQAISFVIENRTSDPVDPVTGQIWLRTDL